MVVVVVMVIMASHVMIASKFPERQAGWKRTVTPKKKIKKKKICKHYFMSFAFGPSSLSFCFMIMVGDLSPFLK